MTRSAIWIVSFLGLAAGCSGVTQSSESDGSQAGALSGSLDEGACCTFTWGQCKPGLHCVFNEFPFTDNACAGGFQCMPDPQSSQGSSSSSGIPNTACYYMVTPDGSLVSTGPSDTFVAVGYCLTAGNQTFYCSTDGLVDLAQPQFAGASCMDTFPARTPEPSDPPQQTDPPTAQCVFTYSTPSGDHSINFDVGQCIATPEGRFILCVSDAQGVHEQGPAMDDDSQCPGGDVTVPL